MKRTILVAVVTTIVTNIILSSSLLFWLLVLGGFIYLWTFFGRKANEVYNADQYWKCCAGPGNLGFGPIAYATACETTSTPFWKGLLPSKLTKAVKFPTFRSPISWK